MATTAVIAGAAGQGAGSAGVTESLVRLLRRRRGIVAAVTIGAVLAGLADTDRLLNTFTELAGSDQIRDEIVAQVGAEGALALSAEVPANTELLVVEAEATEPELATGTVHGT